MTPDLSLMAYTFQRFAGPHIRQRAALLAALSVIMGFTAPSFAGAVDREKNEISIEPRPTADEALSRFSTNVSEMAKAGLLPPFVGERQQIRKILEVMNKAGTKVVYVLGEAGSGKTAMVEYTAALLEGAQLYRLNLNSLEAGTGYRGMLEDRLEALLEAFKGRQDRILFIDEAHVAMKMPDFMDKLKPPMARGELSIVLATTDAEFREFIEKDAALTSRASIYRLENPTEAKVLTVLRANQESLQKKHGLTITNSALEMTARLVMRYYSSEPILRKALDILDRASSRAILNARLGNYDLLALEDKLESLELHQKSLASDIRAYPEDAELRQQLVALRAEIGAVHDRMSQESDKKQVSLMQVELQRLTDEMNKAQRGGDFATAAKIKNQDIPRVNQQIKDAGATITNGQIGNVISDKEIARFVSQEIGIPDALLAENNQQKLKRLGDTLNEKVIGQGEAVNAITKKVKIRMESVEVITGPQAVIMMDGLPGVGKTEMMKAIALSMFGDANRIIRVNMNQLDGQSSSQLFGAGVGIKDSEAGGSLDEVRRRPYTLVSFDEADKAPRNIWTSLLQVLDEGVVKDSRGRNLDFRNTIITLQGNFTGEYAVIKDVWPQADIEKRFQMEPGRLDGLSGAEKDARVLDAAMAMKGVPAAVRDRIGVKLVFNAFTLEMALNVSRKILQEQIDHIWKEKGVRVTLDASVAMSLAKASYDPNYGARPILQNRSEIISDLLAELHLQKGESVKLVFVENADGKGGTIKASVDNKERIARDLLYKVVTVPKAASANAMGEAGKPVDPRDIKDLVKQSSRKARTK